MSYAAALSGTRAGQPVAAGPTIVTAPPAPPTGPPITFIKCFASIAQSTTTTTDTIELPLNRRLYERAETAQEQFSSKNKDLEALNTSGGIQDYVVDFADGETVQYRHKDDPQTRYANLKSGERPVLQKVQDLQHQVQDLQQKYDTMIQKYDTMIQKYDTIQDEVREFRSMQQQVKEYEIATNAIEALSVKMWSLISPRDRPILERLMICNLQQLRSARFADDGSNGTHTRCVNARRIYTSIPSNYHNTLQRFYAIRSRVAQQRISIAHPTVSVADFRRFLEAEFGGTVLQAVRTILTELETVSVRREDGILKRLFSE